MKQLLTILWILLSLRLSAQQDTSPVAHQDTANQGPKPAALPRHTPTPHQHDTTQAQVIDTGARTTTTNFNSPTPPTSIQQAAAPAATNFSGVDASYQKILDNPYFKPRGKPFFFVIKQKERESKDEMFYLIAGLIFILAFIRMIFSRYFASLFKVFVQPTFRQTQTREQLSQSTLPALFFNVLFILSGGVYATLLVRYFQLSDLSFWQLFLYSAVGLALLYLGKYVILSFVGWVFNVQEAANTYTFIVYLLNKILGILLVPFVIVIAFAHPLIINVAVIISTVSVLVVFAYRYIVSYTPVRRDIKVGPAHFMLYILAVEVIPMLLICKTLMNFLNNTH